MTINSVLVTVRYGPLLGVGVREIREIELAHKSRSLTDSGVLIAIIGEFIRVSNSL